MKFSACLLVIFISAATLAGNFRTLSFYVVKHSDIEPVINGNLDDPAWKNAETYSGYYEYYKPNPKISELKTAFKMLYGKNGIYLGIINYEKKLGVLKANNTARDAEQLWKDDCDEIYFDSSGSGVGFSKFVVNSLGTMGDMRQIDASVSLPEWSGNEWIVKTSKTDDAWIVEAFFPWDDLGGKAEAGKTWRFCNVRYAYTSGKFAGATSSPGGCYNKPGNFGYLYFAEDKMPGPTKVGGILLSAGVTPPWLLPFDNELISCSEPGKINYEKIKTTFTKQKLRFDSLRKKVRSLLEKNNNSMKASDFTKILKAESEIDFSKDKFCSLNEITELISKLDNLYWKLKINNLVNNL